MVYGVEEQQLALNEAQIIFATQVLNASNTSQDHTATEWNDTKNRDFTYIELENLARQNINFANEDWQIAVRPPTTANTSGGTPIAGEERRLTFTQNHPGLNWGTNSVYLVGTAGDDDNQDGMGNIRNSEFRVNRNYKNPETDPNSPNYDHSQDSPPPRIDCISPRLPGAINLDLITGTPNYYRINKALLGANKYGNGPPVTSDPYDSTAPKGADLFHLNVSPTSNTLTDADDRTIMVEIELRRRVNPYRGPVTTYSSSASTHETESRDNPWIVVDQISVPMDVFYLKSADQYNEIRNQMNPSNTTNNSMRTSERRDPLIRDNSNLPNSKTPLLFQQTIPAPNYGHWRNNSLGFPNILGKVNYIPPVATYQPYSQYQPLFNRDYGSAMELLEVPLYGPEDTTKFLAQSEYGPKGLPGMAQPVIAANLFLNTAFPNTSQQETGNRWYRLFEFVEVPDRSHRHPQVNAAGNLVREPFVINVGNRLSNPEIFYRSPGRINLNTLRHPQVLGGMLDDLEVVRPNPGNPNQYLVDQSSGTGSGTARDWWVQFVKARDGIDPVTGMILPGLPASSNPQYGSRPFRPFSYSAEGQGSLQSTLLRTLPV